MTKIKFSKKIFFALRAQTALKVEIFQIWYHIQDGVSFKGNTRFFWIFQKSLPSGSTLPPQKIFMGNYTLPEIFRSKNRLNFTIFTSKNCYVSTPKLLKTIYSDLNSPNFRPSANPFYFNGYLEKISWLYLVFSTFYNDFKVFFPQPRPHLQLWM